MQKITGQKDPIIKLLKELTAEDGRRRNSRFFAEGEELVRRAFDYGGKVDSVIFTDKFAASPAAQVLLERAAGAGVDVFISTEGLLAKMLEAKPTPECLAIVERRVASLQDAISGITPLVQMVESCENADNLGMLLRSTDASGVTGVVLTADTTDPFSRRVVRGSRGAVFTVPICPFRDSGKAIEEAHAAGLQVIATSARSDTYYTQIDFTKPTMIIVGNEHTGISDTVRNQADSVVRIPMLGKINSLNIAVAASVIMYEAVRQRS
ncbi:MAG: RNA methyltransferase [Armatimonadota bacterium]